MKRDDNYEKSMEAWFDDMFLNMKHIELSLQNHTNEIELHQQHIKVLERQLQHDQKRVAKAIGEYKKYLAASENK